MKLDLVIVEAYDLEACAGWQTKTDIPKLMKSPGKAIVSVGYMIRNDDEAVVLACTLGQDDDDNTDSRYGDVMIFPKGCIKKITHIPIGTYIRRLKDFLCW